MGVGGVPPGVVREKEGSSDMNPPPPAPSSNASPGLAARAGRLGLRAWLPWVLPYLLTLADFVAWRYAPKSERPEWLLLAQLLVPAVVPLVAALVDGRWRTFRLLMVTTWSIAALQAVVLFDSALYRWMHYSEVDMAPIVLPFLLGYLAVCSLVGAVAFAVAARLRRPRS